MAQYMARGIATFALGCIATVCSAQQQWDKEPDSVFGIRLGEPLSASSVPQCPASLAATSRSGVLCVELGRYAQLPFIWNLPGLKDMRHTARIHLQGDLVSSIHLEFWYSDYERVKAILFERYGKPTKVEQSTVTSGAGAVLGSETLSWSGRKNSVYLFQRFDRIDKSLAAFQNDSLANQQSQKAKEKIKDTASKM